MILIFCVIFYLRLLICSKRGIRFLSVNIEHDILIRIVVLYLLSYTIGSVQFDIHVIFKIHVFVLNIVYGINY